MSSTLKVLVSCGALLVTGCGDSSRIPAELQNDLALASADADLMLASRSTEQTSVVGAVERTTPPARAVAPSARAPRPRRSPTRQVAADVQQENELVEEPEVAAIEEPMSVPAPVDEAPVVVAASTRPRAIEPSVGGAGTGGRGIGLGTIIGIAGTVVLRGGDVGEDRCIPPSAGRGRTPIAINDRHPMGRGTGRVAMGTGRVNAPIVRTAPARPRDIGSRQNSAPSRRAMSSGGTSRTVSTAVEGRATAKGDLQ